MTRDINKYLPLSVYTLIVKKNQIMVIKLAFIQSHLPIKMFILYT